MVVLAIVLVAIIFIALLRFGVSAEYTAEGLSVAAQAGLFSFRVFPREADPKKDEKKKLRKKAKKEKKAKKKAKKPEEKKPGSLKEYLNMLPAVKKTLGRIRRRLLIKDLTVHLIFADKDPSKTALAFGAANAAFGTVLPFLGRAFRIKRRDFHAYADFEAIEPTIYIKASISLAVWEALYIVFAILPIILKKRTEKLPERMGKNGEAPDKRINGDDNAKGKGDDRRQYDRGGTYNNS